MKKSAFYFCEKFVHLNEADQRLNVFHFLDHRNSVSFYLGNFKTLAIFCSCTGKKPFFFCKGIN